jgi:tRNA-dihydrouridine synthase B
MTMKIGTIDIPRAILLAPMEDVTDAAFRIVCKRRGADIVYTEFVNSEGLVRNSRKTHRKMEFLPEERPLGIQLYGGNELSMEGAARMAEALSPDLIDVNCGCWVKNVVCQGAGASLLKDLPRMRSVIESVVRAVSVPVTVKTRLGWDQTSIQIVDVAKMVEDAGAKALTVHCRTRTQAHDGEPDYRWIPLIKEAVNIPIIVNGGIETPARAREVFDTTGCDAVMIARGAIKNPWIFREIRYFLSTGKELPPPDFQERRDVLMEHLDLSVQLKGEKYGVIEFRKYFSGYLHGVPNVARLRAELMQFTDKQQVIDRIDAFVCALATMNEHSSLLEPGVQ